MKGLYVLVFAALFLAAAVCSRAAEASKKGSSVIGPREMMKKEMMTKSILTGMCPMHMMMMSKSMVSTKDDGVIIMAGDKLLRYDKNLELVKEAEVDFDAEDMRKMCEACPECRAAMKEEDAQEKRERP